MTSIDSLTLADRSLQSAQRTSDVDRIGQLLDDRLVFTALDGCLHSKSEDLELHRSGRQHIAQLEEQELKVAVDGKVGVTWLLCRVDATVDGQSFEGRLRYTRCWVHDASRGWRVIAAHVTEVR